ncbi:MAG: hypothetical protein AVDCRST_MAG25-520, partial [uncultured Rubrobacteraceae bacterium]
AAVDRGDRRSRRRGGAARSRRGGAGARSKADLLWLRRRPGGVRRCLLQPRAVPALQRALVRAGQRRV